MNKQPAPLIFALTFIGNRIMAIVQNNTETTYGEVVNLTTINCGKCGIPFAVPTSFYNEQYSLRESGGWYCPNGHARYFVGESNEKKVERLQQERDRAKADAKRFADEALAANAKAEAERSKRLKAQKRICNGVCTHCNRTFQDLQRHMETKHPIVSGKAKRSKPRA